MSKAHWLDHDAFLLAVPISVPRNMYLYFLLILSAYPAPTFHLVSVELLESIYPIILLAELWFSGKFNVFPVFPTF